MTLDEPQEKTGERESNLLILINGVGSWILKFRYDGNILNHSSLVIPPGDGWIEGTFTFPSFDIFQETILGVRSLSTLVNKGCVEYVGRPGDVTNDNNGSSEMVSFLSKKIDRASENYANDDNISSPIRGIRVTTSDAIQPLKQGWLLKKRDIMTGWKCRYFEVFPGRANYYADENAPVRGSISLVGAIVHPVQNMKTKHRKGYLGFVVETKNPDKLLKLASERADSAGYIEATSWHQAFKVASVASPPADKPSTSSPSRSKHGKTIRGSINGHGGVEKMILDDDDDDGSLIPLSRDYEDSLDMKEVFCYALVFLLLVFSLHYLYHYKHWMDGRIYIAFLIVLSILVIIFIQEFFIPMEENARHSQNARKPFKQAMSKLVLNIKSCTSSHRIVIPSSVTTPGAAVAVDSSSISAPCGSPSDVKKDKNNMNGNTTSSLRPLLARAQSFGSSGDENESHRRDVKVPTSERKERRPSLAK
eukprot:gene817-887_t